MKAKHWMIGWLTAVVLMLCAIGLWVYRVDPYFHFHAPDTATYFYPLNNQRSQNDGIVRHFNYDAIITGTSMTENFKSSEMDEIFGCNSIKIPFSGATFKEINDTLKAAIQSNPDLKIVVRGLDTGKFFDDKDSMRLELGTYPTYLYDRNPLNDVQYIWNRDVIWNRVFSLAVARESEGFEPGITPFDVYSNWMKGQTFGINTVKPGGFPATVKGAPIHMTDKERATITENITQNVTALAKENPDITFYYFITPYSAYYWEKYVSSGSIYRWLEAEKLVIELILECDNIKLFSFNTRADIVCNFNHYKDGGHYAEWINSLMLRWMHDGKYQLTKDNYMDYLDCELDHYSNLDYTQFNQQPDYECDDYAAALCNQELTGAVPKDLLDSNDVSTELSHAQLVIDQFDGSKGIRCIGRMERAPENNASILDSALNGDFVGASMEISHTEGYRYLTFYGKKVADHGCPSVYVLDEAGDMIGSLSYNYDQLDNEWHQYVIKLSKESRKLRIVFQGGYVDNTGSPQSEYIFSNIVLY